MSPAESVDVEAFTTALREQMEQNARMADAFDELAESLPPQRGAAEGFQRSLEEENRRLKNFAQALPFDIPEADRAENWSDITTLRD